MTNVLADLAVEQEAATVLGLRLAAAVDAEERAFLRLSLPIGKYLVCKRTPALVAEALECLGGNGYVEESGLPLLFRESPLNSIWEGSGSIQALDVLRALRREPEALDAYLTEVGTTRGEEPRLDRATDDVLQTLAGLDDGDVSARGWRSGWPACCRAPCWCGTPRNPSPMRSARGWSETPRRPMAPSRAASTSPQS